jgi:hypothetical protein
MRDVPQSAATSPIRLAAGRALEDDHRYGHS